MFVGKLTFLWTIDSCWVLPLSINRSVGRLFRCDVSAGLRVITAPPVLIANRYATKIKCIVLSIDD